MTWLRVSCDFAVKKSDGMLSSEGLTRARESASNIWYVHTAVGRSPHSLLAVGRGPPFLITWTSPLGCLSEYPHNMVAGFLQRK